MSVVEPVLDSPLDSPPPPAKNSDPPVEELFESADQFILNRPNIKESLAFGRGPHNCPGAALARLQLRVALEELLARTTLFEIAGPIIPTRMPEIGVLSVKMRFTANTNAP